MTLPHVEIVREPSEEVIDAVTRLLGQLTTRYRADASEIADLIDSEHAELLIARDQERAIVATATVSWYPTAAGRVARMESVVVDASRRRSRAGSALIAVAETIAAEHGARWMQFSTGLSRDAAHHFYESVGYTGHPASAFSKDL